MKVYVVIDYDTIEYAGTSRKAAIRRIRGSSAIWVWEKGEQIGWLEWDSVSKSWKEHFLKKVK
jgi:hypothetical protein